MSRPAATLFIDRDGTLVEEPPDEQVDSLEKIRFMPGVFAALAELERRGYRLVMVTNQDGLGHRLLPAGGVRAAAAVHSGDAALAGDRVRCGLRLPAPQGRRLRLPQAQHRPGGGIHCASGVDLCRQRGRSAIATPTCSSPPTSGCAACAIRRHGTPDETWPAVVKALTARRAQVDRRTRETEIDVRVDLDDTSPIRIATGIGFFDHMLEQLAKHGGFALELTCKGDLEIDEHHTVEDCALALGEALRRALGSKVGIARYGFLLPMDEAQAQVAIDLSGRAFAQFSGRFNREAVGGLPTELVPHFFRSLAESLGAAVHVSVTGENSHHMIEACFKGVGRALRQALRRESRELPSTKGVL